MLLNKLFCGLLSFVKFRRLRFVTVFLWQKRNFAQFANRVRKRQRSSIKVEGTKSKSKSKSNLATFFVVIVCSVIILVCDVCSFNPNQEENKTTTELKLNQRLKVSSFIGPAK